MARREAISYVVIVGRGTPSHERDTLFFRKNKHVRRLLSNAQRFVVVVRGGGGGGGFLILVLLFCVGRPQVFIVRSTLGRYNCRYVRTGGQYFAYSQRTKSQELFTGGTLNKLTGVCVAIICLPPLPPTLIALDSTSTGNVLLC